MSAVDVLAVRKLGEAQTYILEMLNPEWDGKPDSRARKVLQSLERRGLVRHQEWPRECWSITDDGRAAIARCNGAQA